MSIVHVAISGQVGLFAYGSYDFYPVDLAILLGGFGIALNVDRVAPKSAVQVLSTAFFLLYLLWLMRGLGYAAPWSAVGSFRVQAVLLILLMSLAVQRHDLALLDIVGPLSFGAIALVALIVTRVALGDSFLVTNERTLRILSLESRPIDAVSALYLGCCAILFISLASRNRRYRRKVVLALLCLGGLLIARQRSAQIATVLALTVYICLDPRMRRVVLPTVALLTFVAFPLLVALSVAGIISIIPEEFLNSLGKVDTFNYRKELWMLGLQEYWLRSTIDIMIGSYSGYRPNILIGDVVWNTTLHNMYVQTLSNVGILGFVSFVLLVTISVVRVFTAAYRNARPSKYMIDPAIGSAWLAASCVFGLSYEWVGGAGMFFALAIVPAPHQLSIDAGEEQ